MSKLSELIKYDKYTHLLTSPSLLLMTRNFSTLGKISKYADWHINVTGNGIDEISFTVHKYVDGFECPVWDDLIDLKIVDVNGIARFEIQVEYSDADETVKSIHGVSLEAELGQIYLNDFHVNDDDVTIMMDENKQDSPDWIYDDVKKCWYFRPTCFYVPYRPKNSLLHRVLQDKAPHWTLNHITEYIALDGEPGTVAQRSDLFQRTYTVDGTSVYDFLTGDVAEESNVIFDFDTVHREINCYCLSDCYDAYGNLLQDEVGKDTTILVSKNKLAKEITISSNKDSIKNCFKIEGGDDVITNLVRAANMNGSNYIYQFADFQLNDMPANLRNAIINYQNMMESSREDYYGEHGIFTYLSQAYENLLYLKSGKMPNLYIDDPFYSARLQWIDLQDKMTDVDFVIGVDDASRYDSSFFKPVTRNVEAMANVLIDGRYTAKVAPDTDSYSVIQSAGITYYTWDGVIEITRDEDGTVFPQKSNGVYPASVYTSIRVWEDQNSSDIEDLPFTRQKIEKALAKLDMTQIHSDCMEFETYQECYDYFDQFCLDYLTAFKDGFDQCLSILMNEGQNGDSDYDFESDIPTTIFNRYVMIYNACVNVFNERNLEVFNQQLVVDAWTNEQKKFVANKDFKKYIGDELYEIFCSYRREDTYSNGNFVSDGLTTEQQLAKAYELIQAAEKEIKKSCVLQRTIEIDLVNLLSLQEFNEFYDNDNRALTDSFDLFNYIRVRTDDEMFKMRIIGVEYNGENPADITVTFSDQIESIDGKISDLESIIQQASSISSSYDSTALQAKQGSEAKNSVTEIYNQGLNAARTQLVNNDYNEVTVTNSGIICKRMDDEGRYGDKQLRITGNIMAFTDDAWRTVKMAIGETDITNPVTENTTRSYGIIGEHIIGKLLVGDTAYIGNENGTVLLTGDGVDISSGTNSIKLSANSSNMFEIKHGNSSVLTFDNAGNLSITGIINATSGTFNGTVNASGGAFTGNVSTTHDILAGDNTTYVKLSGSDGTIKLRDIGNSQTVGVLVETGTYSGSGLVLNYDKLAGGNHSSTTLNSGELIMGYGGTDYFWVRGKVYNNNTYGEIGIVDGTGLEFTSGRGQAKDTKFIVNNGLNPEGYSEGVVFYSVARFVNGLINNSPSDLRSKKDINLLSDSDKLEEKYMSLKPVEFMYKDEFSIDPNNRKHFGFVANDVVDVFPENDYSIITTEKQKKVGEETYKDFLTIDRDEIIALNTAMIQKLNRDIKELKEKINECRK